MSAFFSGWINKYLTSRRLHSELRQLLGHTVGALLSQKRQEIAAQHQFHDYINGFLIGTDTDQLDDIGMPILLQYLRLFEKFLAISDVLRSARLHGDVAAFLILQLRLVDVAEVSLTKTRSHDDRIVTQRPFVLFEILSTDGISNDHAALARDG